MVTEVAQVQSLVWELPCAVGKAKKTKEEEERCVDFGGGGSNMYKKIKHGYYTIV